MQRTLSPRDAPVPSSANRPLAHFVPYPPAFCPWARQGPPVPRDRADSWSAGTTRSRTSARVATDPFPGGGARSSTPRRRPRRMPPVSSKAEREALRLHTLPCRQNTELHSCARGPGPGWPGVHRSGLDRSGPRVPGRSFIGVLPRLEFGSAAYSDGPSSISRGIPSTSSPMDKVFADARCASPGGVGSRRRCARSQRLLHQSFVLAEQSTNTFQS